MGDTLRLSEAARLLSIGDTTLKRWTEEGRIPCLRTAGGHRRFRREEVVKFRSSLLGEHEEAPPPPRDGDPRRWLDVHGDPSEPTALLGRLLLLRADSRDWAEAGDLLCAGLLQEIGDRSAAGKMSAAQEHEMSRSVEMALARTSHQFPVFPGAPVAVLACPTPERHTLGLTLLETVLRERGFSVRFLGADVPSHEIVDAVRAARPALVGLSASSAGRLPSDFSGPALAAASICRETQSRLVLGGTAPWPPVRGAVRVLTLCDLAQFVDTDILHTLPAGRGMFEARGFNAIRTVENGVAAHAS
jgi:excisionase family DNA binding protein